MAEVALFADDDNAQRWLKALERKVMKVGGGAQEFGGLVSSTIFQDVVQHFEEEEGPEGRWEAWSKVYKEHMVRLGKGGNKLLQDSGRLRQAFTPAHFRKVSEGLLWYNPAKARGGFPYAAAHNTGGGRMPQREFMWVSDEALAKIESLTLAFILEES